MEYPCTKCGACCRRVHIVIENLKEVGENNPLFFPYKAKENGHCEMLTDDNKCSVYQDRPLVCNIDKLIDYLKVSKEDYYALNIAFCNTIMDYDKVHLEYRIK